MEGRMTCIMQRIAEVFWVPQNSHWIDGSGITMRLQKLEKIVNYIHSSLHNQVSDVKETLMTFHEILIGV